MSDDNGDSNGGYTGGGIYANRLNFDVGEATNQLRREFDPSERITRNKVAAELGIKPIKALMLLRNLEDQEKMESDRVDDRIVWYWSE